MLGRAALGLNPPVPPDRAGATATTLQNTVTSQVRIRAVPPMTSADRSASPSGLPLRSGDASVLQRERDDQPAAGTPPSGKRRQQRRDRVRRHERLLL